MELKTKINVFGPFWVNIAKLMSASVLSQAVIFVSIPILTRMYSPDAFGVAAVFTGMVLFLSPISSFGYHQAIVLPKKKNDAFSLCYLSLFLVIAFSAGLFIPFGLFASRVARFLNTPDLVRISWLLPFAVFSRGICLIALMATSRAETFGLQAVSTIVQTLVDRLFILGVGFMGHATGTTIICGRFLASLCETGVFTGNIKQLAAHRKKLSWSCLGNAIRRYKNFPLFANWITMFSLGVTQLPVYIMAFFFSPEVIGLYAMSNRLLRTPMMLLGDAVRRVYYQAAAQDQQNEKSLKTFFSRLREKLIAYGLFPFLILSVISEDFFPFLLGPKWSQAGSYVKILCFITAAQFVSTPIAGLVNVVGLQREFLQITAVLFLCNSCCLILGGIFHDPFLGLWLFVSSGIVFYGYLHLWIGDRIGIKKSETVKLLSKYITINIFFVMIVSVLDLDFLGLPAYLTLVFVVAVLHYILMLYLVDRINVFSKYGFSTLLTRRSDHK